MRARTLLLLLLPLVLLLGVLAGCDKNAARPPLDQRTAAGVRALAEPWVKAEHIVGLVIGVIDGERESTFAFGRMGYDSDAVPNQDTVFEIGSVSKTFTGLLLARASQEELSIDDLVQKHIPTGVTVPSHGETPMTLAHLSTHSSGLPRMPSNFAPKNPNDPYADYDGELVYAFLESHALGREPGTKYEYSNVAAGLLGHILGQQAGSYDALLEKEISSVIGMASTCVSLDAQTAPRFASPHLMDTSASHPWTFDALTGAGGIRSTVRDMLRYVRFHLDAPDTPLGRSANKATSLQRRGNEGEPDMGLGWHIAKDGHRWHNGQTGGYHSFVGLNLETGRGVVVLSNTGTGIVDRIGNDILKRLAGIEVEDPSPGVPLTVDRQVLDRYTGSYQLAPSMTVRVRRDGHRLLVQLTGQPELRVFPESNTAFVYRVVEAKIVFEAGDKEPARRLVLHQNGMELPAPRKDD